MHSESPIPPIPPPLSEMQNKSIHLSSDFMDAAKMENISPTAPTDKATQMSLNSIVTPTDIHSNADTKLGTPLGSGSPPESGTGFS